MSIYRNPETRGLWFMPPRSSSSSSFLFFYFHKTKNKKKKRERVNFFPFLSLPYKSEQCSTYKWPSLYHTALIFFVRFPGKQKNCFKLRISKLWVVRLSILNLGAEFSISPGILWIKLKALIDSYRFLIYGDGATRFATLFGIDSGGFS